MNEYSILQNTRNLPVECDDTNNIHLHLSLSILALFFNTWVFHIDEIIDLSEYFVLFVFGLSGCEEQYMLQW